MHSKKVLTCHFRVFSSSSWGGWLSPPTPCTPRRYLPVTSRYSPLPVEEDDSVHQPQVLQPQVLTCPRVFSFFKLRRMAPSTYHINSKKALTCLSRVSFFKLNRMTLSTECPITPRDTGLPLHALVLDRKLIKMTLFTHPMYSSMHAMHLMKVLTCLFRVVFFQLKRMTLSTYPMYSKEALPAPKSSLTISIKILIQIITFFSFLILLIKIKDEHVHNSNLL